MKYFLDTEFHERTNGTVDTIELISIGIVAEDGRELYMLSKEFDLEAATNNKWLADNVLLPIFKSDPAKKFLSLREYLQYGDGRTREQIRDAVIEFVGEKPEFYGYYADYDWVVFCWLFGRMIDLPKGFPMYCRDLKQMFDAYIEGTWEAVRLSTWGHTGLTSDQVRALPDYPKQENEHNALDDARWNKRLYEFLMKRSAE